MKLRFVSIFQENINLSAKMFNMKILFSVALIVAIASAKVANIHDLFEINPAPAPPTVARNSALRLAAVAPKAAAASSPPEPNLYAIGERENGDALVGSATANRTFATPQNIKLTLNYPQNGAGANVTRIESEVACVRDC